MCLNDTLNCIFCFCFWFYFFLNLKVQLFDVTFFSFLYNFSYGQISFNEGHVGYLNYLEGQKSKNDNLANTSKN